MWHLMLLCNKVLSSLQEVHILCPTLMYANKMIQTHCVKCCKRCAKQVAIFAKSKCQLDGHLGNVQHQRADIIDPENWTYDYYTCKTRNVCIHALGCGARQGDTSYTKGCTFAKHDF